MTPLRRSLASDGRVPALDGLRGVAALVVVLHHLLLATKPRLANAYLGQPYPDGISHLVTATPLHVLWDGPGAVVVFFVLSGYVLSLAPSAGRPLRLASYYPARVVRLYVPVWGAVLFAALTRLIVPRSPVPGGTWALNAQALPLTAQKWWDNLTLLNPLDATLNGVLWSLRWEVAFSLLLPLVLLVARRVPRVLHPLLAAGLLVAIARRGSHESLQYLPVFGLGVLMAFNRGAIERAGERLARLRIASPVLLVAAICALEASWWAPVSTDVAYAAAAAGGALIVGVVLISGGAQRLLGSRPALFVGRRSYSLYLVHIPIVVAVGFALGTSGSLATVAPIALPIVAVVTLAFHALVERPSHRASRAAGDLGQRAAGALGRRVPGPLSARS